MSTRIKTTFEILNKLSKTNLEHVSRRILGMYKHYDCSFRNDNRMLYLLCPADIDVTRVRCVLLKREEWRYIVISADMDSNTDDAKNEMPSSWNEYINTVMLESGYVSKGAIYGIDGKKWATSQGFELSKDDIMTLVQGFTDPIKLYTDGIRIGGRTFTCTRSDSGLIVGRESSAGHGCIVYRCNKCLVIAVHEDGAHPGGCHVTITKLGDYLRDQGI